MQRGRRPGRGFGGGVSRGSYGPASAYSSYGGGYADYDATGYSNANAGGYDYSGGDEYSDGTASGTFTSSSDPASVKSRVFVGNLNTFVVTREQIERLFSRFGPLVGVSIHKGYGFVQFTNEPHARSAVSFTDGMTVAGQKIDVNISDEPKSGRPSGTTAKPASGFGRGTKRPRYEAGGAGGGDELYEYPGYPDKLTCGNCKESFSNWNGFKNHRKQPCTQSSGSLAANGGKSAGEPDVMNCFICKQKYDNSWSLVQHLGEKHNMQVFS